jgi:DNA-binding transcriptional LysR family regulator
MEMGSNEAIKQTVAGRLGISILSRSTVRAELASGEIVVLDVAGLPLERCWHLAHQTEKSPTPAAKAFHGFLTSRQPPEQLGSSVPRHCSILAFASTGSATILH